MSVTSNCRDIIIAGVILVGGSAMGYLVALLMFYLDPDFGVPSRNGTVGTTGLSPAAFAFSICLSFGMVVVIWKCYRNCTKAYLQDQDIRGAESPEHNLHPLTLQISKLTIQQEVSVRSTSTRPNSGNSSCLQKDKTSSAPE